MGPMVSRSLVIVAVLASVAVPVRSLEVRTYTASELGFLVSSHLLLGSDNAILVDAQFTRSEARDVARMVSQSGRKLEAIFITHGRPEHYLGLEVLARSFPEARVLARPATVAAIRERGADAVARWQPIYLDDLPTEVIEPEPFTGEALWLDGTEIRVLDLAGAESGAATGLPVPLYVPQDAALFASDLALGAVHPWLDGVDLDDWLDALEAVRGIGAIEHVYPGHGSPSGAEALAESAAYLTTLRAALAGSPEPAEAVRKMREAYPEYRLAVLLERSLNAAARGGRR